LLCPNGGNAVFIVPKASRGCGLRFGVKINGGILKEFVVRVDGNTLPFVGRAGEIYGFKRAAILKGV
jgi:hypothetical protein